MTDVISDIPVGSYSRTIKANAIWVVIGTIFGLVSSILYLHFSPTTYTATAVVNVEVVSTSLFKADRPASNIIDMQTEAVLAGSYSTALLASENLDRLVTPVEIRSGISVSADESGTIMRIRFSGQDAKTAQKVADGVATSYLGVRAESAKQQAAETTQKIDDRLAVLQPTLESSLKTINSTDPGSTERANAEADAALVRAEIDSLVNERASLFNLSSDAGELVTPASSSPVEDSPNRFEITAAGILGGFVLGIVLTFVREMFARSIGSKSALERMVTVPVWTSDEYVSDPWSTAFELLNHAVDGYKGISIVALGADTAVDTVAEDFNRRIESISTVENTEYVPRGASRAATLAAIRTSDAAILVLSVSYSKSSLFSVISLMEQVDANVLGIAFLEKASDFVPSSAGDSSE